MSVGAVVILTVTLWAVLLGVGLVWLAKGKL